MAKAPLIGYTKCPECDNQQAEIRRTKNGLAYRYCEECNAQYFPRDKATSDRLESKAVAENAQQAPPKVEQQNNQKSSFSLESL